VISIWTGLDVVIVRTAANGQVGRRRNLLLMNEDGVLTDRTTIYAAAFGSVSEQTVSGWSLSPSIDVSERSGVPVSGVARSPRPTRREGTTDVQTPHRGGDQGAKSGEAFRGRASTLPKGEP